MGFRSAELSGAGVFRPVEEHAVQAAGQNWRGHAYGDAGEEPHAVLPRDHRFPRRAACAAMSLPGDRAEKTSNKELKPPQRHLLDHVIGALCQDQRRARPRRQDVVLEIGKVGPFPDRQRGGGGFFVGQRRIAVEIRSRIVKRGVAKRQETSDIPVAQHRLLGVDIDRKVEKIRNDRNGLAVARKLAGLQNIDAFDDQDVRAIDLDPSVRDDVIGEMRIDRRAHRPPPGLDVAQERQQRRQVIALRKALFLHDALPFQHGVRKQETVRRHHFDPGPRRPAGQQCLQHARGGGLADRYRTGDADDVGHLAVADAEKLALRLVEPMRGIDIDRKQPRQRQIDVLDFLEVEAVVQRPQPLELARFQRHRGIVAQMRPLLARKYPIGIILLLRSPNIHKLSLRLVAFARCLLFQSGHRGALRQRGLDFLKLHAARFQQHQQVKQQVGAFGDEMAAIVPDRGDHGFHRLLAELPGAMLRPLVQQFAGVGRLSSQCRAGIDGGGEIMDCKTRHQLNSNCSPRDGRYASAGFSTSVTKSRQGSSRIGSPARTMWSLASRMVNSPKWKIDAASTAVACPSRIPLTRWSRLPTPPDAIAGTGTLSATAWVSGMSKPWRVPSRSMEVSRISPAPSETTSWAYSIASMPVELRPPWVKISHRSEPPPRLTRLASIATTMH